MLIPGLGVQRNGSRSWFGVGSFLIQPSEFFKLALILSVSDYLASKDRIKSLRRDLLVPLFLTMLGFGLILDVYKRQDPRRIRSDAEGFRHPLKNTEG